MVKTAPAFGLLAQKLLFFDQIRGSIDMITEPRIPDQPAIKKRAIAIGLFLAIATFLAYARLLQNDFVSFDDPEYILDNRHVSSGLSWAGLKWAFNIGYASNWHPLTWISHMFDCSLFGLNPAYHHLINLGLHISATLLLFAFLFRQTRALWRSALIAALFALHPLHVESVAWASERKDVLSALFFILSIWAYAEYSRKKNHCHVAQSGAPWIPYLLSLVAFALGLMSKPMLVTLPFVLLLLDAWPLKRFSKDAEPFQLTSLPRLLLEKIPFFALAVIASVITVIAQKSQGAVASLQTHPLGQRIANSLVSYARYFAKTFWPGDLTILYPYPAHWPASLVLLSALLLFGGSVLAILRFKRAPHLFAGWFWFLGMLVPTIGLVQVGAQSIADRYMYLPGIGLFVALVWGGADLYEWFTERPRSSNSPSPLTRNSLAWLTRLTAGAVLALCFFSTSAQLKFWKNGETLFRHALALNPDNASAHEGVGAALVRQGREAEALSCFAEALRLNPTLANAQFSYATVLMNSGHPADAPPAL